MTWIYQVFYPTYSWIFLESLWLKGRKTAQFNFSSDLCKTWLQPSPTTAQVQGPIPPAGPGSHFKLSAAKEARSALQQLCADLHPAHSPHFPQATPEGTAPTEGMWEEVMSEQKLNYIASGYILCSQTVAYICLGVCSRNSRKTREKAASKLLT